MSKDKSIFRFKKFEVRHGRSNMKVGTDGVLLACWAAQDFSPNRVLDIGTGCGLIALILAQRFPDASITGIDVHLHSIHDALENKENFKLSQTIDFQHIDFLDYQAEKAFDLLISNPPYFSSALLSEKAEKNLVRHQINLTIDKLLTHAQRLLSNSGNIALILPVKEMQEAINFGSSIGLYPSKICHIHSFEHQAPVRMMVEFTTQEIEPQVERLIIYESERVYTKAYKELTSDFYLAF